MLAMIQLTNAPIDPDTVLSSVASRDAGAVVLFLGTTREFTRGRRTLSLDYECYPEMAEKMLAELEAQARERWPLTGCSIVHRLGHLELGEASIAIAVSSPHRAVAFEAGQWLIDTIKQVVPIWKQENWADGTSEWVHPGITNDQASMINVQTIPKARMSE
jgi:molybdopterin synthase catalytic subunit